MHSTFTQRIYAHSTITQYSFKNTSMQSYPAYAANTKQYSLAGNNCLWAQMYNKLCLQVVDFGDHRWVTTYSCTAWQTTVRGYVEQSLTFIHTFTATVLLQEILKRGIHLAANSLTWWTPLWSPIRKEYGTSGLPRMVKSSWHAHKHIYIQV